MIPNDPIGKHVIVSIALIWIVIIGMIYDKLKDWM